MLVHYTKEALQQMAEQAKGKPITLGIGGPQVGTITGTELRDSTLYVRISTPIEPSVEGVTIGFMDALADDPVRVEGK